MGRPAPSRAAARLPDSFLGPPFMAFDPKFIRNFSIVAHIDHGKSTLADQLLLQSGAITQREFREQLLDDMDLERERGITIKARAVAINYTLDGQTYELNLIDTPGHVDFHYEVSRSLAACEGAILLVDATQGVQAQTVANAYAAINADLAIVPALNKIDMQAARPDEIKEEIEQTLGIDRAEVLAVSGKTGQGVPELFRAIIERIPPPAGKVHAPLRALIFDSKFDDYQGVITYVRVVDGTHQGRPEDPPDGRRDRARGHRARPVPPRRGRLRRAGGRAGRLRHRQYQAALRRPHRRHDHRRPRLGPPAPARLPGAACRSSSAASSRPRTTSSRTSARRSQKLSLNDASFTFEPETSDALGFGFRCGFLGMLHMEIIQQRLERESNLALVQTAPNVTYEICHRKGETLHISNPTRIPDAGDIEEFREPVAKVSFILPSENIGAIMQLCDDRRGTYLKTEYITHDPRDPDLRAAAGRDDLRPLRQAQERHARLRHDGLRGHRLPSPATWSGSTSWSPASRSTPSRSIVHRDHAYRRGQRLVKKLKGEIDRHQFEVAIQAAIGSKIIARETISALRKNVTAKCYGGDITRKRKLLEKQKEGKKRMKQVGNVEISQEAFLSVLDDSDE